MAMRPPTTGRSYRRPLRRIFEDIKPVVEFFEEEGATLLQVNLPGFKREQISTSYNEALRSTFPRVTETPARITIKGERPLGNNKWRRFNTTLAIPGDCDATRIQTKLEGGFYTITIPKRKVASLTVPTGEVVRPSQEPPSSETMARTWESEGKAQNSSSSSADGKNKEKLAEPPSPQKTIIHIKVQEGQEDAPDKLTSTLTDDIKKKVDKRKVVSAEKVEEEKMFEKKQRSEDSKDSKEPKQPDENVAGASASEKVKQTGGGNKEHLSTDENSNVRNLIAMETIIAASKKHAMNPLAISHTEEKQLLVNLGVSLIVIVAVGSQIVDTFWT